MAITPENGILELTNIVEAVLHYFNGASWKGEQADKLSAAAIVPIDSPPYPEPV
jgi:hypothetical protein